MVRPIYYIISRLNKIRTLKIGSFNDIPSDYKFDAAHNSINLLREYYQEFSCEFDLQFYPFDTQVTISSSPPSLTVDVL